ncbi:hypothetical protein FRB96_002086 [Tulasnella sp. 330]|nr:hypothetical protein FRB96_002086 [Tulasnella sp. 330]
MPLSFSICNGCNCTPKEMQTPKLNIGIRTKKWAVAHGLHIPDNSIPPGLPASSSNETGPMTSKAVRHLTSIQSKPERWDWNVAAINDLYLILRSLFSPISVIEPALIDPTDKKISADLANPNNIFIIVTDIPNIDKVLNTYLQGAHASIFVLRPTLNHMVHLEMSVRYATSILRPGDRCTMWFGCYAEKTNAFEIGESSVITGANLRRWMTEHTSPKVLIRVRDPHCYPGRESSPSEITFEALSISSRSVTPETFSHINSTELPWSFNAQADLVASSTPDMLKETARIICVSACRESETAHLVETIQPKGRFYGGLLWYLMEHLGAGGGSAHTKKAVVLSTESRPSWPNLCRISRLEAGSNGLS